MNTEKPFCNHTTASQIAVEKQSLDEKFQALLQACKYDFPNAHKADPYGEGMVAQGGDLDPETLVSAYSQGLFPWFDDDDAPIAWWSPDPRCVLEPSNYKPSKSLKKQVKNSDWQLKVNSDFEQVIRNCALPRKFDGIQTADTWITEDMQWAYGKLHTLGFAHSIEVWDSTGTQLYGGLYGLKLGGVFFGESMFYKQANASKIAFWYLTLLCQQTGVELIDCQLPNDHLTSLGASIVSRHDFLQKLPELVIKVSQDSEPKNLQKLPHWQSIKGGDEFMLIAELLLPKSINGELAIQPKHKKDF